MVQSFTVGVAQIDPRLGDVAANLDLYETSLREAKGREVDLLVFPELSLTGYFLKDMVSTVALAPDAPVLRRLRTLSKETVAFVAGLVEETPEFRFYNAAVLFDGGEIRHVHRKAYLPTYGLFDELRYLARGDRVCAFESRFGRMALLLCEDLWHPSTAYIAAMDRALTVLVPSASPIWGIERGELPENAGYWQRLNAVTAESYGMFLVYANRVGFEDGVGFWGGSEIVTPSGEVLARAAYYEPDMIVAEVRLAAARRKRIAAPMLRDENIDLTINELLRIRGRARPAELGGAAAAPPSPPAVRSKGAAPLPTSARTKGPALLPPAARTKTAARATRRAVAAKARGARRR